MILSEIYDLIENVMNNNPVFDAGYFLHDNNERYKGIADNLGNHFYIKLEHDGDNFTSERFAESCDLYNIEGKIRFVAVFTGCIDFDLTATALMKQFNTFDIQVTDISIDAEKIYEEETGHKPKKQVYVIRYKAIIKKLININDCYIDSLCPDCCEHSGSFFEILRK